MKWGMNRLEWSDVTCVFVGEVMLKVSVSFQQVIVSRETEGSSSPAVEKMLRQLSPEDTGVSLYHTTRQSRTPL